LSLHGLTQAELTSGTVRGSAKNELIRLAKTATIQNVVNDDNLGSKENNGKELREDEI
jgi:hypothetical protein